MRYLLELAKYVGFFVIVNNCLLFSLCCFLYGISPSLWHMKLFLEGRFMLILIFVVYVKGMIL